MARGLLRILKVDLLTDGSGNASATPALPTCELEGVEVILGTAASVDVIVANMGRDVLNEASINASVFVPVHENGVTKLGAAISNSFAKVAWHGRGTITIANGGAGTTLSVLLYYR